MTKVYLLLGGNIGDKAKVFSITRASISGQIGEIISQSHIYETEPWGFESNDHFWNQVVEIATIFSPEEVLRTTQKIENELGRSRKTDQYVSRIIDIDILFFGNEIIQAANLKIPHPKIQERKFALVPMNEIAPKLMHPIFKKTISQLLAECTDQLRVEIVTQA